MALAFQTPFSYANPTPRPFPRLELNTKLIKCLIVKSVRLFFLLIQIASFTKSVMYVFFHKCFWPVHSGGGGYVSPTIQVKFDFIMILGYLRVFVLFCVGVFFTIWFWWLWKGGKVTRVFVTNSIWWLYFSAAGLFCLPMPVSQPPRSLLPSPGHKLYLSLPCDGLVPDTSAFNPRQGFINILAVVETSGY